MRWAEGTVAGHEVVACVWDFSTYGGSLGEREAAAIVAAAGRAARTGRPLLTFVRTGGTRMQEGMAALVGIPRAALALQQLAAAGVPHLAVADQPTTGGVWVSVVSAADLRVGVAGATVGFSGPRVVEAMTGERLPPGSHTAEGAHAAGLLDAVLEPSGIEGWLGRGLAALRPAATAGPPPEPPTVAAPQRSGYDQVQDARASDRPEGGALLDTLLDGTAELRGADDSVRAVVGRSAAGRPTVGVALAAHRGGRPTPAGYALLARAGGLADRLGADLLTLVDTPGADPGAVSEAAGVAPAIGAGMTAVLGCRTPTLCVVHGEGGSGGALAAATTDRVLVTEHAYFTALGPEGAGAALRLDPAEAAARMRLAPADLLALGFADATAPADPNGLRMTVAGALAHLGGLDPNARLVSRRDRWAGPLPGRCTDS